MSIVALLFADLSYSLNEDSRLERPFCARACVRLSMIKYTDRIARLMEDIVLRVPSLGFIDLREVLVFARQGRTSADGAYATCHCLNLPPTEPGYYYWKDRRSGKLTRRSEWFVTKSPVVTIGRTPLKYLISFVLPRFCDQTLAGARKSQHYTNGEPWLAKLDTVVHELYHIDPDETGIRRIERADGTYSPRSHGPEFYERVAVMVQEYLASGPDPALYDFLRFDFAELTTRFGGVVSTTFRNYPSYPQRYIESVSGEPIAGGVQIVPLKPAAQPSHYTEDDLHVREFHTDGSRRVIRTCRDRVRVA